MGIAHGGEERVVVALLQAQPHRVEAGRALERGDDAFHSLRHGDGGSEDRQDLRLNGEELLRPLARGDVGKTVYVPGGTLPDGSRVVVDAMPSFRPGDSCYVFIDTRGWVMGGLQGKLDVAGGRLLGSGETTAAMSRRIEAALRAARPAACRASGARRTGQEGARGVEPVPFIAGVVGDAADDRVLPGVVVVAEAELHPATSPPGEPTIISITPGEAFAGTDTHVTIKGADFGSARGKVELSYGRGDVMRISAGDISSWTDSSIDCAVPTGVIANYDASAGSRPVVVTTSDDRESNAYGLPCPSPMERRSGRKRGPRTWSTRRASTTLCVRASWMPVRPCGTPRVRASSPPMAARRSSADPGTAGT